MEQNPQSQLKLLVTRGKEQGYLTYAEVNDHLPEDIVDSDQIEDIIQMINDMGIQVMEEAPDADDLLLAETSNNTDEDAEEAAAQVLSSVESEIGRTTDPVRMYMREMGTVELLTREGEIDIAKRIEDGINQVQCSVAEYPEAITYLLEQYDRVEAEEARLSDLITGFVDPNAEEDMAPTATHVGSELSQEEMDDDEEEDEEEEDDSDDDNSIDPELAREKFGELRTQYELARDTIKAKGRSHAAAQEEILKLSEVFKQFRLVPKQFDYLVNSMRVMMDRVRTQERIIMKLCVEQCKMPKKNFITLFTGNETSETWFNAAIAMNKPWSEKLHDVKDDVHRGLQKLHQIEEETGLTVTSMKFRGILTFICDKQDPEYICLYTIDGFRGQIRDCDEGVLKWVPKDEISRLNLWEGDRIFFDLIQKDAPFFSLKLRYEGDQLMEAVLNGEKDLVHIFGDVFRCTGTRRK